MGFRSWRTPRSSSDSPLGGENFLLVATLTASEGSEGTERPERASKGGVLGHAPGGEDDPKPESEAAEGSLPPLPPIEANMEDFKILLRGALSLLLYGLVLYLVFSYGLATADPNPFFLGVFCPVLFVVAWKVWPPRAY